MKWTEKIPDTEIQEKVTDQMVQFAKRFGEHLAKDESGKTKPDGDKALTTSQLRKFFGEVKRQQMNGYDEAGFVMLKPKLAYAVGRVKVNSKKNRNKIEDFEFVMSDAIDKVVKCKDENKSKAFDNFISFFEAIVAYHKAFEADKDGSNNNLE